MRLAMPLILLLSLVPLLGAQTTRPGGEKPREEAASSPEALVEKLGSPDYETRSAATEALRALGEKARAALEKGVTSDNLERRTRSRNLLDALDVAGKRGGNGDGEQTLRPLDRRRLREDLPRVRSGRRSQSELLDDLERRLEAMDRLLNGKTRRDSDPALNPFEELLRDWNVRVDGGTTETTTSMVRNGERLTFRRRSDGSVSLEIVRKDEENGRRVKKTLEAKSLEDFKTRFPQVYKDYRDSGIFTSPVQSFSFRFGPFGENAPGGNRPPLPRRVPLRPARTLGVVVNPVPEVLRAHLQIPREAVLIEDVLRGSAAEKAGLKRYDVLLSVNGESMGSALALRRFMSTVGPGKPLRIRILRHGKPLDLEGVAPGRAPTPESPRGK